MTEHPDVKLARRAYEAMAKGDLAAASEGLADDVTWHGLTAGPLGGTYHGRDEVLAFFGRLAEETGGTFRLAVHDVLANNEHTVVLCTMSASAGTSPLRSRWPTSATSAMARSLSSGAQQPTRRRALTSGPERTARMWIVPASKSMSSQRSPSASPRRRA